MRDDQIVRHNPQLMIVDSRICDSTPWLLYNEYRHIYRSLVSTSNEVHTLSEWTPHCLSMFALNNFEIEVATIPSRDTSTTKSHFLDKLFVDLLPTSHDVGCYRCCCFSAGSCTRDSSPVFYILVELSKFGTALILYQCNHSTLLLLNANLSIWQLVF